MASVSPSPTLKHLVVPGQIIAVSSENDEGAAEGFLRGHGTYIEALFSVGFYLLTMAG